MESVRVMLLQYGHIIQIVDDPRDVAQQEIVNIVMEIKGPITFSEAVKVACQMNIQVKHYLGNRNLMAGDNKRYHDLREIFMDNMDSNRITITQLKPLTLVWSSRGDTATTNDLNDLTDLACDMQAKMMKNNTESLATTKRVWSERLGSDNNNQSNDPNDRANSPKFEFECYYCNGKFQTNYVTEYFRHGVIKHPKKPLYPSKASLEEYGLKAQGKN